MHIKNKYIIVLLISIIKFSLFAFAAIHAPESKYLEDSKRYLNTAKTIISHKSFAILQEDGKLNYELYRTPGYPFFLGVLNNFFKISLNGVIVIQILLTLLAAYFTCKTAFLIDKKLGFISFVIVLFDPPTMVYSLMILTEALFLFLISLFIYVFVIFLKGKRFKHLILSSIILAIATYVRPVSYFLGGVVVIFLVYALKLMKERKVVFEITIFLIIFYGILGLWHLRNYKHFSRNMFCGISGAVQNEGLYKSYSRNKDPYSQHLTPLPYYINVSSRSLMSIFTRPASLKYFKSKSLKRIGKVLFYSWIAFWIIGFIYGMMKTGNNTYFHFLILIILYFSFTTVFATMWGAGPRFRIPMVPSIAILSAYGWDNFFKYFKSKRKSQ